MPRFIYLLGLGMALIGLALAVTDWVMGPHPGATEANARRIRPGMTLAEVEAILGGPGRHSLGDGEGGCRWDHYSWVGSDTLIIIHTARPWLADAGTGTVTRNGVTVHRASPSLLAAYGQTRQTSPSFLARLRSRLGW
jgi:hypothetical protein